MQFRLLTWYILITTTQSLANSRTPLLLRSQTLAQFFRGAPNSPAFTSLEPGKLIFKANRSYATYWGLEKRYILDGESIDDNAQIHLGIIPDLLITLELSQRQFTKLPMDDVSVKFHQIFGIPQNARTDDRRNDTRFSVPDYGLELNQDDNNRPISQQLGLKVEKHLNFSYANRLAITLEVSQENSKYSLIRKGAQDFGLQLGYRRIFPSGYAYAMASGMIFDGSQDTTLYLRSRQASFLLGGAWITDNLGQFLIQGLISESPFIDLGQLSRYSYEVHLGYRRTWGNLDFELGLIENIIWPYNTPDWGLSFGICYQIRQDRKRISSTLF